MARPSVARTPFAQRLTAVREALGHKERKGFAGVLGINPETLGGYERGDTFPDQDFLRRYRHEFSVNLDWLITGEGEKFMPRGASASPAMTNLTDFDQPGMIAIPRYDEVQPSAGHGSVAVNEVPSTRVAFERHWLADIGVQAEAAVILPAQGDSMEPTIRNGSPMLVDTSKKEVRNGFIYVFDIDGDLVVKRIERLPDGTFDLISDNRNYPIRNLSRDSVTRMTVIGRVYAAVSKF